eukprot:gene1786-2718_t
MARRCVARQVRSRGSTHNFLNWHNLDYHTESYHSLTQASMYDNENRVYNIRKSIHKWDSHLSPLMYGGSFTVAEPSVSAPMPFWINEHLFARTYWNTNLNLYYWENFHLSFYYIERLRLPLKQVFSNNFVFTPRWAYNLVLLYTKNPTWDFVDIGLRMKTMLYVNSHVWLVFKFKMHKVARLNGIERGIRNREESTDPLHDKKPGNKMSNQENLNHYVMDDDAHDHRQEGAGAAHHRNYAHNMRRLDAMMGRHENVVARPIVKAHKSSEIAKLQLQSPSTKGVCCAKVGEAEVMLRAGIKDILLSNEVIGLPKLRRLTRAMTEAGVTSIRVVVDSEVEIEQLAEVLNETPGPLSVDVLIEVNCGQDRCGVASPEEAVALAEGIKRHGAGIRLIGIQAYHGSAQHIREKGKMEAAIRNAARIAGAVKAALLQRNLFAVGASDVVVTGAGSGTLEFEMASDIFTEVQP